MLSGICAIGFLFWKTNGDSVFSVIVHGTKKPEPDKVRYEVLVAELHRWQEELGTKYKAAKSPSQKAAVEHDARLVLEAVMPEMMRCWLGTPYDFNGTAEKPGEGKVACGYFVSTVIRDSGFRVNRYKLAQQPSENIMRTFLPGDSCLLQVGRDYDSYADWLEGMEDGVYLIGLDTHVGFILKRADGIRFLHSSGARSVGVVEEMRRNASALRKSQWRMLGNFTGETEVVRMWLRGEKLKVRN